MHTTLPPTPPAPLAYRPAQAARLLGISRRTLCALTSRGEIRSIRVSQRCTLYRTADLSAWLTRMAGEVRP